MRPGTGDQLILLYDRQGHKVPIRYRDLRVQLGWDRSPSLVEALEEEGQRTAEFRHNRERFRPRLERLNRDLRRSSSHHLDAQHEARQRCLAALAKADPAERRTLLGGYYTLDRDHARLLDDLVGYLLAGSEDDHSSNEVSLIRFSLNHLLFSMRNEERKTGGSAAFHSIEAARGAAKNGQSAVTILATLLHDLVEDRLDDWSRELICRTVEEAGRYAHHRGKSLKQLPDAVRSDILRESIDAYNDRAAGIYYGIGLALYSHVRLLHAPERYFQTLHSLMEMLARLSRTRDISYYNYLQRLLNPGAHAQQPDPIRRSALLTALAPEIRHPEALLDDYLRDVDGFYLTPEGTFYSRDEIMRNTFREMLAKILDRLNNTRDMSRDEHFSIAKRLYGAGYKNIYFVQAVEHRLRHPGLSFEERRLIETKFINKPKLAALYQVLQDVAELERELSPQQMGKLRDELDVLKCHPDFHIIRSPRADNPYDGIILLFNDTILGNKRALESLTDQPLRQARIALAFQAVLENFIAYPAMIQEEMRTRQLSDPGMASFDRYRIQGMGTSLELRAQTRPAVEDLPILSFKRTVLPG